MKTVLLVPGYTEDINSRDYHSVIQAIKKQGYAVKFIPIHWKRSTISDWVKQLDTVYIKHDPRQTILAGFSFGAMTAFMSATKRNPSELWLFSLSPYFNEDLHSKNMRKSWLNRIGHRRVSDFDKLKFDDLAKTIRSKTLVFAGEVEINKWPGMKVRAINAEKSIQNSKLYIVSNVGHDVSDRLYVDVIKQTI